jgi:hypothetical protein
MSWRLQIGISPNNVYIMGDERKLAKGAKPTKAEKAKIVRRPQGGCAECGGKNKKKEKEGGKKRKSVVLPVGRL